MSEHLYCHSHYGKGYGITRLMWVLGAVQRDQQGRQGARSWIHKAKWLCRWGFQPQRLLKGHILETSLQGIRRD